MKKYLKKEQKKTIKIIIINTKKHTTYIKITKHTNKHTNIHTKQTADKQR